MSSQRECCLGWWQTGPRVPGWPGRSLWTGPTMPRVHAACREPGQQHGGRLQTSLSMPSPCLQEAFPDCCVLHRVPLHVTWLSGLAATEVLNEAVGSFWTGRGKLLSDRSQAAVTSRCSQQLRREHGHYPGLMHRRRKPPSRLGSSLDPFPAQPHILKEQLMLDVRIYFFTH